MTPATWFEVTFLLSPVAVALLVLVLAVLASLVILAYRRQARRARALAAELEAGNSQNPRLAEWQAARESYRHFIYNISHEVSNPLQSIQTNLDNMVAAVPESAGIVEPYHAVIADEIRRLARMTENLRTLSRLETPNAPVTREPVNLKGVIEDVIITAAAEAEEKGLNLQYVGPPTPVRMLGDRDQLKQLLLNLVQNSIKYSHDDGGTITIGLDRVGARHRIRISDEGIGIAKEDLEHIFEVAYRSPAAGSFRRRGSGLGLTIARRIVEQHGGDIRVESRPGTGTTVWIELPAGQAEGEGAD